MEEQTTVDLEAQIIACVAEALVLDAGQSRLLDRHSLLMGAHPAFDSMAVMALITALEDRLGVPVAEDIDAAAFASIGSLVDHLSSRLAS